MTVLGALLAGTGGPVLQTCRFEGMGGSLYGRQAVARALAGLRPGLGPASIDVETPRLGVWMDADHAVAADLVEGRVQRLWVLCADLTLPETPAIHMPADRDLAQAGAGTRFEGGDHPDLAEGDRDRIAAAVDAWPALALVGPRPLVLRAASFGSTTAALVRLEGDRPGPEPLPAAVNGLVVLGEGAAVYRHDRAQETRDRTRAWTPRF